MVEEVDMKFYIVTPTYNAVDWLKRAIRSVADQVGEGVEVHHHVQDGGSTDGTQEWLSCWKAEQSNTPGYTFTYESAPDKGMYDALNKAWDKLPEDADVTAHLNSDEQYLPRVLERIGAIMSEDSEADMVLGSYIIADAEMEYHCHRRPVRPHAFSSTLVCVIATCSCFYKVSTFKARKLRFDTSYKSIGDLIFFKDIMQTSPKVHMVPELMTSFFVVTGCNLAWTDISWKELERYFATLSFFQRKIALFVRLTVNFWRRVVDLFCASPKEFSVYREDDEQRTSRKIIHPTCIPHHTAYKKTGNSD